MEMLALLEIEHRSTQLHSARADRRRTRVGVFVALSVVVPEPEKVIQPTGIGRLCYGANGRTRAATTGQGKSRAPP